MKEHSLMKIIIIIFIICCILFTFGFIVYRITNDENVVKVNGYEYIPSSEWKIEINNIKQDITGNALFKDKVISSKSKLELTYSLVLSKSGDSGIITFDVENNGTMDARLNKLPEIDILSESQEKYLSYTVKYNDDTNLKVGDIIKSGEKNTIKIIVKLKDNINYSEIVNEDIDCSFSIDYVQNES